MRLFVGFFLGLTLLGGGIARLILALRPNIKQPPSGVVLTKSSLLIIAVVNIVFSIAGITCLVLQVFEPLSIGIFVLLVTSLVEIFFRLKSGDSVLRPKS